MEWNGRIFVLSGHLRDTCVEATLITPNTVKKYCEIFWVTSLIVIFLPNCMMQSLQVAGIYTETADIPQLLWSFKVNCCVWFQASATKWMRTMLFWVVITQWLMVISYRLFGTTYHSHIQGSSRGLIGCHETSVRNYHYLLRNNPEEHSSQGLLLFVRAGQCGNIPIMDC